MTYQEHNEPGRQGAMRATWRGPNFRLTLRSIIDADPAASEEEWRAQFIEEAKNDEELLQLIISYAFDNALMSFSRRNTSNDARVRVAALKEELKGKVKKHIDQQVQVALLSLLMPNGKLLANCTGPECRKFGGWFVRIADKVKRRTVGEVLSEADLQSLRRVGAHR